MKFSIRDLFLVTMIVALVLLWWTERSRLQRENWRLVREKDYWKVQYFDEQNAHKAASHMAKTAMELHDEANEEIKRLRRDAILHTSSAPAPNPPKK